MRAISLLAPVLVLLTASAAAAQRPPQEPLVDQVRKAIDRGKSFLLQRQSANGDWEAFGMQRHQGGATSLALLALLNAGVAPSDPALAKGLKWLREVAPATTYAVGLQTMVFCLAGQNEDRERIERNVKWLIEARRMEGETLTGWKYDQRSRERPDNSNMQYALLGLHEAQVAGFAIDPEVWRSIRKYYIDQQKDGGWGYQKAMTPSLTMTTAGLCGLIIAGMDLNKGREVFKEGRWEGCGSYEENRAVTMALEWLGERLPTADRLDGQPYVYYYLYGLERAGRLTGLRFLGEHDWYRIGCEYLVARQGADGAWRGRGGEASPVIATGFALLFLSKGRTPILISKLTHDGRDRSRGLILKVDSPNNDWNNDRNDARHLVEYASRELFKKQPLAWQVFNPRLIDARTADGLVAELLQSPIAYFNGHWEPAFTPIEEELLRRYVENGGFILGEACCSQKEFDRGFRDLMARLFPETPLQPLPDEHPLWTAAGPRFAVKPNQRFKLEGIQMGCKTVVVYSPQDLSCWWESNQHDQGDGRVAFRVAANIIAYATGLELPQPRLTEVEVLRTDAPEKKVPRGYLKVAQLRHRGDWQPAPRAMPNLMRELRDKAKLDVALQAEEVYPDRPEVVDFKFLYMHGRGEFRFDRAKLADLRFNLETGGLLLADACCGSEAFNKAFRNLIADLWPDGKYKLERIPLGDDLFSQELNGAAITRVRCRHNENGKRDREYQEYEPFLEGVKINGRWAVIYSKYDIGCALEKTKSPDCLGHDYDSAVRLGTAVVLYALKR
jgi:hypothetical protein